MRLLPVVLRPEQDEALVSWLHRIAALYQLSLGDIVGHGAPYQDLAICPDQVVLQAICRGTRLAHRVATRHTFRGHFVCIP